jgi:hypothetical protein
VRIPRHGIDHLPSSGDAGKNVSTETHLPTPVMSQIN